MATDPVDLLNDLEGAVPTDDGAYSRQELQQIWNCGSNKALRLIAQLSEAGRVEVVDRKIRTLTGAVRAVKVYRFVNPTKTRKKK